jgi:beta-N-acetylhexosaminidase
MRLFFVFLACVVSFSFAKETTLDSMISQMILVGFSGESKEDKWVTQITNDIKNDKISGVLILSKNIKDTKQLKDLTTYLQDANNGKYPLFIAIEEEGGSVQTLGFSEYIDANILSKTKSLQEANRQYETLSKELSIHGINLNFAPVLDLMFDNNRSYSDKEEIAISYASEFIDAMHKYNVLNAIKYFPGLGIQESLDDVSNTWDYKQLKPYFYFINAASVDMIMVGHIKLNIFDENYVASMSSKIVTEVLRKKLGFDGVVISQDLLDKSFLQKYQLEKSIIKAIQSGVDILVFSSYFYDNSNIPKIVYDTIHSAIKRGDLSEEMISSSYQRVIKLKNKLLKEEL